MNIKNVLTIILVGVVLVGAYVLLNVNYEKGVEACVEKGNDVTYCEYHAS